MLENCCSQAGPKAFNSFTKEEQSEILKLQRQEPSLMRPVAAAPRQENKIKPESQTKLSKGLPINDAPLDNIREDLNIKTIGRQESRDIAPLTEVKFIQKYKTKTKQASQPYQGYQNQKPAHQQPLSAPEIKKLEKKLNWMSKNGKIKGDAARRPLKELISEVIFHVKHRSEATPTFDHALRAAAKMLREGRWLTPKRLSNIRSIELERRAKAEKQQELREIREANSVWKNLSKIKKIGSV